MRIVPVLFACALTAGISAAEQQKATASQEKPPVASAAPLEHPKPLVPVKVQIVLTRFKGEKKISSLPYLLGVTANDGMRTSLRMGIDVPVMAMTVKSADSSVHQPTTWNYRSVGTNIDCRADSVSADTYKLQITVSDSSIHLEASQAERSVLAANVPAFRSFNSTFTVLMRDAQTTQYTSAVDPVNGEVMKIDVTLNVMK